MPTIIANQQTQAVDLALSPWAQFGLPGIVIGALFGVLVFFIRQHYHERREYREDIKEIAAKHDATSKEMTDRFIDLHKDTLNAIRSGRRDA